MNLKNKKLQFLLILIPLFLVGCGQSGVFSEKAQTRNDSNFIQRGTNKFSNENKSNKNNVGSSTNSNNKKDYTSDTLDNENADNKNPQETKQSPDTTQSNTSSPTEEGLTEIVNVDIQDTDYGFIAKLPIGACAKVSGTPIYADPYILFNLHEDTNKDCGDGGKLKDSIIAYNTKNKKFFKTGKIGNTEPALTFDEDTKTIFMPFSGNGAFNLINDENFNSNNLNSKINTSSDSSALTLDNYFYFGTINHPILCQRPEINEDCGALFKIDQNGEIKASLNYLNGLRAWITGAPTSDGKYIYVGTGASTMGEDEPTNLNGCSVIKLDKNLNIIKSIDVDSPGCYRIGNLESAIVGEVAIGDNRLWAQTNGPSDDRGLSAIIQYDTDLNEICRAEFSASKNRVSATFYQSPVIDKDGNAYAAVKLFNNPPEIALYKIRKSDCEKQLLAKKSATVGSSPTLADDKYVLFAAGNGLSVNDTQSGETVSKYQFSDETKIIAAPLIVNGIIYVLTDQGNFIGIENSGINGYGNAIWPRMRHDNAGTGNLIK